jgi:hypothetical protein
MLFYFMHRRMEFDLRPLRRTAGFAIPGASVAAAAALAVDRVIANATGGSASTIVLALDLALAGTVAALVYLAWSRLVRLPELATTLELARTILKRDGSPRTGSAARGSEPRPGPANPRSGATRRDRDGRADSSRDEERR